MTIESEAFRLAEQIYCRPFDDQELIRECKSIAHQLGRSWQEVWNATRCAYNSSFQSE